MLIHRLTATFGVLQGETLELQEGLNIIQIPDKSVKSAWCAFLTAMLYGLKIRDQEESGPDSDWPSEKNDRMVLPGQFMRGQLNCSCDGRELKIMRSVQRSEQSVEDFHIFYADTPNQVPGIDAQNCGEILLGINRKRFERSVFLKGSQPADRNADMESDAGDSSPAASGTGVNIIDSREQLEQEMPDREMISYREALKRLRMQQDVRQNPVSGKIADMQQQLQNIAEEREQRTKIENALTNAQAQVELLRVQEMDFINEQYRRQYQEALEQVQDVEQNAKNKENTVAALRQQIEASHIPDSSVIGRLRGAIVNMQSTTRTEEKARKEQEAAALALQQAEKDVQDSPFFGLTAEQARAEAMGKPPLISWNRQSVAAIGLIGTFGMLGSLLLWRNEPTIALSASALILLCTLGSSVFLRSKSMKSTRFRQWRQQFGSDDTAHIQELAEAYCQLLLVQDAAAENLNAKSSALDTVRDTIHAAEEGIIQEVRRFAPDVDSLQKADQALREAAVLYRNLQRAEAGERKASSDAASVHEKLLTCKNQTGQTVQQQNTPVSTGIGKNQPGENTSDVLPQDMAHKLDEIRTALRGTQTAVERLNERLNTLDDFETLQQKEYTLRQNIRVLHDECGAIALMIAILEHADTEQQNNFPLDLGKRTGEIFSSLARHYYQTVTPDSRTASSSPISRSAASLDRAPERDGGEISSRPSQEIQKWLYFALRLAACELLRPKKCAIPIILDDALTDLDDAHCLAALRFLKHQSDEQQIIIFTSQAREAALLQNDPDVRIQNIYKRAY